MKRRVALAVLVSLFFLYLLFCEPRPAAWLGGELGWREAFLGARLDWREVGRLLLDLRGLPFAGALAFLVLSLGLRAWRWRVIAGPLDRVPLARMFHLTNLGYMANNVLPMRLGEVLRAGALSARSRVALPGALATVVLERALDLIGALAVLLSMLALQHRLPPPAGGAPEAVRVLARFEGLAPVLALGAGGALALLLALVVWRSDWLAAAERLLGRLLPARAARRLRRTADTFAAGLEILRSPGEALLLLGQTALIYGCYLGSLACMLGAYGLSAVLPPGPGAPLAALLLLLVFVSLGYMIPAAPGAFGTAQYFTALALRLLGAGPEQALGFALGNHLITWLVLTLLGLAALPLLGLRLADLTQWKEKSA